MSVPISHQVFDALHREEHLESTFILVLKLGKDGGQCPGQGRSIGEQFIPFFINQVVSGRRIETFEQVLRFIYYFG